MKSMVKYNCNYFKRGVLMNDKTLASVVKEAREKLGISQRELSRRTGIDNNTVAKIEKGERRKPNVLSLRKLSAVLRIDIAKLMKLAEYNEEEIKAVASNNYNSFAIHTDNVPVIMIDDIIETEKEQLQIRRIIKELLDDCDVKNLKIGDNLQEKDVKKLEKLVEKYKKKINNEIEDYSKSIEKLSKLINKKL